MDKVGVMAAYSDQLCLCLAHCICCHNTDLVHVNGHDRTILVIFSQALYMLKDRRGYCQLKEEVLDRTLWRNRFGRDFGPVVWQITDDDDDCTRLPDDGSSVIRNMLEHF